MTRPVADCATGSCNSFDYLKLLFAGTFSYA